MSRLVSSFIQPSFQGAAPLGAQLASFPALPAGEKVILTKTEARKLFDANRARQFKTVTALFNSKETSDAWSAMQNNPVFVQLARDPNNATNKEVLKEYMKNNNWWIKEEIAGRLGRTDMIPPDEQGTILYEKAKHAKFEAYVKVPYAKDLQALGIDPTASVQPDAATMAYAKLMKEPTTYLEATVLRAVCGVAGRCASEGFWTTTRRRKMDSSMTCFLPNVTHSFSYVETDGTEAECFVTNGLSGTAARISDQIDGRLVDMQGKTVWDDALRKRLVELVRKGMVAETDMLVAAWKKVYGDH